MEVTATKRGGQKLSYGGYSYTKKPQKNVAQTSWRCVKRDPPYRCPGLLHTTASLQNPTLAKEHTHLPDPVSVQVVKFKEEIHRRAGTTNDTPNQIFTFAVDGLADEVKNRIPPIDSCKRQLRRIRAKHRPRDPGSLQDLNITGEWRLTTGPNLSLFLQYDNGQDAPERIVMFSTDNHLQRLARAVHWDVDGTFHVVPQLFTQLYVFHGKLGVTFFPLVYALMERKTQSSYEELFRAILEISERAADPDIVIMDFERAARQAVHAVFGPHVVIQGCFYHLTQSIWREIQELGLIARYREHDDFRLFCGQLDALAFLPLEQVTEGMDLVRRTAPEDAVPLVDYFDATYLSGVLRRRRQVPPIFPPDTWNPHQATMDGNPRTNNVCEGWNNMFSGLVAQTHPTVWKLIECLRADASKVSTQVLQDARGVKPKKRGKTVYQELQRRLKNLCDDRVSGRKTIQEFLHGVSRNLRAGQPDI